MKMLDIFKMRIRCMSREFSQYDEGPRMALYGTIKAAHAAREYYFSGRFASDELRCNQPGHNPFCRPGAEELIEKYGFDVSQGLCMTIFAHDLAKDIEAGRLRPDGTLDFRNTTWTRSPLFERYHAQLSEILAKMYAKQLQRNK